MGHSALEMVERAAGALAVLPVIEFRDINDAAASYPGN